MIQDGCQSSVLFPALLSVSLGTALLMMASSGLVVWGGLVWWQRLLRQRAVRLAEKEMQREKAIQMRRRSRTLEKILAVSARLNTTHNISELHGRIVDAMTEIAGFQRVVLHLWSDSTQAFEARAFQGVPDKEKAQLREKQISRPDFMSLCNARNRFSNCYLVTSIYQDRALDSVLEYSAEIPEVGGQQDAAGQILVAPLVNSNGEETGFLVMAEPSGNQPLNVVDIRQLEFLVQHSATALESADIYQRLARNNADLQLASEKLGSLNDMKNNFVANVSHELRTPLTSISAYTELLRQSKGNMADDVRDEFLKVIHTESQKLTGVIDNILDLDRMAKGPQNENQNQLDLTALVRRLEESWKSRALEMDITLSVVTPDEPLEINGDGILLQQMLGHLMSNAFKFTEGGGSVIVTVQETGTALQLVVEDTGQGIPEEELVEIFSSFYQVDGSATRQHNGQGVGLTICQDIVSHHDGRIWAENVEPHGARFTVLLPRRAAVLQPVDPAAVSGNPFQPGEFMQRIMHWVSESLGVQTATLMVPDVDEEFLAIRAAIGLSETVVQSARVRRGSGIAGRVWETGQTLLVGDITKDERYGRDLNEPRYSTPSLLCVPLYHEDEFLGVLSVNNRVDGVSLDDDDRQLLLSLRPILGTMLVRYRRWQDDSRHFGQIRETLRSITSVGHYRQECILETCQEICLATARHLSMSQEDLEHLAFALHFYDVGLGFVPHQLLNKPGSLNPQERHVVEKHVDKCLETLEPLKVDSKVRQLILNHHENIDGSGYPYGLKNEAIPLGSRLLRLTDTLAALLSQRPWRPAFGFDEAIAEIKGGQGVQYCPRLSGEFLAEAEKRRERIVRQQAQGMDHRVFKRPVLEPDRKMNEPVGKS